MNDSGYALAVGKCIYAELYYPFWREVPPQFIVSIAIDLLKTSIGESRITARIEG